MIVGECDTPVDQAPQDWRSLTDLALIFHRQAATQNPPSAKTR